MKSVRFEDTYEHINHIYNNHYYTQLIYTQTEKIYKMMRFKKKNYLNIKIKT